jgi:hypothetical protein
MKKRDIVNVSYYDKLVDEAPRRLEMGELRERNRQEKTDEFEQNFSLGSTEATIPLPPKQEDNEECKDNEEYEDEE